MFGALLYGGRLVVVPKETAKDAVRFKALLETEKITILNQTPSAFYALQEELLINGFDHALRHVIFGGVALNPNRLMGWQQAYPDCQLVNMYGITETTVHVTYKVLTEKDTAQALSNIGKPLPTMCCYVLDEYLSPVPIGVPGELYIGGAGVAQGYLNRSELTASRFITNPFNNAPNSKLYQSGDLARWLPDGSLEYIGRADSQVKIRGYRIELGEVEQVLSKEESISQSCVLAQTGPNGDLQLVGYVVADGEFDKETVRESLKAVLPDYMVPAIWVSLAEMPLTTNGKLDKQALSTHVDWELATSTYVAPQSATAHQLVAAWQLLLGVERVGVHDNFFELGGHSLLAIKLLAHINRTFNTALPIDTIFTYPTVSMFGQHMDQVISNESNILLPLQRKGDKNPIYLAPPGGGRAGCYMGLAQSLGKQQPVYGLQCPGLFDGLPLSGSIEEMAAAFISAIQQVDPHGPYRLGGYSFGGWVAYEMALQLQRKGFKVDELIIFDAALCDANTVPLESLNESEIFESVVNAIVKELFGEAVSLSGLGLARQSKAQQMATVCKLAKEQGFNISEAEILRNLEVSFNNQVLMYQPANDEKLDTKITLFKALENNSEATHALENGTSCRAEDDYGWGRHSTKEVSVHPIAATHLTLLADHFIEEISMILKR